MELIRDLLVQGVQMLVVVALAPALLGLVRKVRARLMRRRGASILQPYRDLLRLMRKDVVLAENASWLFRRRPLPRSFAATSGGGSSGAHTLPSGCNSTGPPI